MTKKVLTSAIIILLVMACHNAQKSDSVENKNELSVEGTITEVAFGIAKNYFVKNTINELDNPKIETAEKFNEIFGKATTMGNDGKPTEIDFKKQYVIAVVLPETDSTTTITPISLQKEGNKKITFTYKRIVGQKQSFTIKPCLVIIVNNTDDGDIILNEQR